MQRKVSKYGMESVQSNSVYDKDYYKSHCGEEYERDKGWEKIFGNYADRIVKEINPMKTLDIGCAKGFLVEALRDRGVEAYGIDISEYAISQVRDDIRPYCRVGSATETQTEKYDLVTCIEVLEHLDKEDIVKAIDVMCSITDDIIFSSTPFDYEEETHISVHPVEYWVERFYYNGFYHDLDYDCSYIAVQTLRFKRTVICELDFLRNYERKLFQLTCEVSSIRHQAQINKEEMEIYKKAYNEHVDLINQKLNPEIQRLRQQILITPEKSAMEKAEEKCRKVLEEEVIRRKQAEDRYDEAIITSKKIKDESYESVCYMQQEVERIEKRYTNSFSWKAMAPVRGVARGIMKLLGRL